MLLVQEVSMVCLNMFQGHRILDLSLFGLFLMFLKSVLFMMFHIILPIVVFFQGKGSSFDQRVHPSCVGRGECKRRVERIHFEHYIASAPQLGWRPLFLGWRPLLLARRSSLSLGTASARLPHCSLEDCRIKIELPCASDELKSQI